MIDDLIFLRDALSEVEQEWEYEFSNRVADLESTYVYALEKIAGKLKSISKNIIDAALPKLLSLVKQNEVN